MSNIIKLKIKSKDELAKRYIPELKYGGIFVDGYFNYELGDEAFLVIDLPKDAAAETSDILAFSGSIAWVCPDVAIEYVNGIGIQFNNDSAGMAAKDAIEAMLEDLLKNCTTGYTF